MEFMTVPDTYYEQLKENLKHSKVKISEDLDVLQVGTVFTFDKSGMFHEVVFDLMFKRSKFDDNNNKQKD